MEPGLPARSCVTTWTATGPVVAGLNRADLLEAAPPGPAASRRRPRAGRLVLHLRRRLVRELVLDRPTRPRLLAVPAASFSRTTGAVASTISFWMRSGGRRPTSGGSLRPSRKTIIMVAQYSPSSFGGEDEVVLVRGDGGLDPPGLPLVAGDAQFDLLDRFALVRLVVDLELQGPGLDRVVVGRRLADADGQPDQSESGEVHPRSPGR